MEDNRTLYNKYTLYGLLFLVFVILSVYLEQPLIMGIPIVILSFPKIIERPSLVFYLLLFCIPFSAEIMITDTLGTDMPDEFLMITVSVIVLLLMVANGSLLNKSFFNHPLFRMLLLHLCWIVVATVFSTNRLLSIKYLLAKCWYILPFVFGTNLFVRSGNDVRKIAFALTFPAVLICIYTLVRQMPYSFSFESIKYTLDPFFRNHVVYGAYLSCMVPVVVAAIYTANKKRHKQAAVGVLVIILLGIIFSYSRGAWLSLLVALLFAVAVYKKLIRQLFIVTAVLILAICLWLSANNRYVDLRPDFKSTVFHNDFNEHMIATYRFNDVSTAERFYRWIAAVRMSADHPVVGVGPNNFYDQYKAYTVAAYKTWVSNNADHSTTHNYFLLLLSEQGLPGVSIFILLLYFIFTSAQNEFRRTKDIFNKTCALTIAAVLAVIVTENFLNDFIETDKIGSIFYLCIGLLLWAKTRVDVKMN